MSSPCQRRGSFTGKPQGPSGSLHALWWLPKDSRCQASPGLDPREGSPAGSMGDTFADTGDSRMPGSNRSHNQVAGALRGTEPAWCLASREQRASLRGAHFWPREQSVGLHLQESPVRAGSSPEPSSKESRPSHRVAVPAGCPRTT